MTNSEKIKVIFKNSKNYTPQGIINDFEEWSGGWNPKEVDEDYVEEYITNTLIVPMNDLLIDYNSFMSYLYGENNY